MIAMIRKLKTWSKVFEELAPGEINLAYKTEKTFDAIKYFT